MVYDSRAETPVCSWQRTVTEPPVWLMVIGVPDPDFGEAVVAVVVPDGGPVDEAAVRAAARSRLAAFKVPKRVHVVDALPRNTMGKVEKAKLRQAFGDASTTT